MADARMIITAAAIAVVGATAAHAQSYTWTTDRFNDRSGGGQTAMLTLGVPETDDNRVRAICSANGNSGTVRLLIGYNTGKLRPGRRVSAQFLFDANVVHRAQARVHHSESGEGIYGLRFDVPLTARIWDVLANYRSISMNADGRRPIGITLRGSSRAIDRFKRACANIWRTAGNVANEDRDNEENNVASATSCKLWGKIKSRDSRRPVTIRFHNRTRSERTAMWLDYQGRPKEYKRLRPGESYTQQTFIGHPWMFVDGPGNCKEIFVPERTSQASYNVTFDE
ncbi:MAG: hypothetical protein AAFY64_04650 [Pseudomonadota bacterium]